jgi:hypothetical protein
MKTKLQKFLFSLTLLSITGSHLYGQKPFNEESAFLWKLKLDTLPVNEYTEEYLYRFQKGSYRLYKNDEFEIKNAMQELESDVNNLPKK